MKYVQIVNLVFLALTLCFALAIPVVGIGSAAANWKGMCIGFSDSIWPCPWWEFAQNEMFWASFIFIPLTVITFIGWGIFTVFHWGLRKYWMANNNGG